MPRTRLLRALFLLASLQWALSSKYIPFKEENTKRVNTANIDISEYCPRAPGCMIPGMHILCLDQLLDFGPDCDMAEEVTITPDIAVRILTLFNLMRSRLAKGLEQLGENQKAVPRAYGMNLLHWDSELATFAQLWAKQCLLGTDACHGSAKFPLSSQLRMDIRLDENWNDIHENKHYNFTHNFNEILMKILSNIYNGKDKLDLSELFECKTQCIGEPRFDESTEFNAYPYVINSDSTHVGCGMATFVKRFHADTRKLRIQKIVSLICNFSHPLKVDESICNFTAPTTPEYSDCGCGPDTVETKECLCTLLKGRCNGIGCLPPVLLLPIFTAEPAGQSQRITDTMRRRKGMLKYVQKPPAKSASNISSLTSLERQSKGDQMKPLTPRNAPTLIDEGGSEKRNSNRKSRSGHGPEWEAYSPNDDIQRPPRYNKHGPKDREIHPSYPDLLPSISLAGHRKGKSKTRHLSHYAKMDDVPIRKNYDVVQNIFNKYLQARREAYKDNPYMNLINGGNLTEIYPRHHNRVANEHIAPTPKVKTYKVEENYDQINKNSHPSKQSLVEMIDKLEEQLGSMHLTSEVRAIINKKINGIYSLLSNKHTNQYEPEHKNDKQLVNIDDSNKQPEHETEILSHRGSELENRPNPDDFIKHKHRNVDDERKLSKDPADTPRKEVATEETVTNAPKLNFEHHSHNHINNHPKYPMHLANISPRSQKKDNQYEKTHVTYDHELGFKRIRPVKVVSTNSASSVARVPSSSLGKRPIISNEQDRNRRYEEFEDDDKDERSRDVERHPSRLKRTDSDESTEERRRDYYEERGGRKLYK